jgi:hypothetical protein
MRLNNDMHKVISEALGEDDSARWAAEVYKQTSCGAHFHVVSADTVMIGSIVKGSDAEVGPYPLEFPFTVDGFVAMLEFVEDEADQLWRDANVD